MRLIIALLLPWLTFFTIGRPFAGIICLILQITLIGWIPATLWAVYAFYKKDLYFTKLLKRFVKAGNRVYFLVNRSVQLVARNRECPKELNNVPCVVWSCIKMHATHKIVNYISRLIIRATSCTLRGRTPYASRMVFIVRLWVAIIKVR